MARHEPWFKPRDEDGDDQLLDWLGGRTDHAPQQQTSSSGGLGCPLTAAPVAGAVIALLAVRFLKKGKK